MCRETSPGARDSSLGARDSISRVQVGMGSIGRFPRSVEVEVDVGDIP